MTKTIISLMIKKAFTFICSIEKPLHDQIENVSKNVYIKFDKQFN